MGSTLVNTNTYMYGCICLHGVHVCMCVRARMCVWTLQSGNIHNIDKDRYTQVLHGHTCILSLQNGRNGV